METFARNQANYSELNPVSFLRRAADVFPEKTAIVYGERRQNYAEFARSAEVLAAAIRSRIEPGDRVAFLAPNIPELLIAHFAVPMAGGVLVALNARLSRSEIRYILDHADARMLFADAELASTCSGLVSAVDSLDSVIEISDPEFGSLATAPSAGHELFEDFLLGSDATPQNWSVTDELAPITLNYTSGTTGSPKGVLYSYRGAYLSALGELIHNKYDRDTVYLWTLPMFHCNGWSAPWAVTAAAGTHVCLRAVRGEEMWQAIDTLAITHLSGSPTVCEILITAEDAHPLDASVTITTAGAAPSPNTLERLQRLGVNVVHVYGLTEVYGPLTINEPQSAWDQLAPADRSRLLARQGVAMVQAEPARVVDARMMDVPADAATIGEIVLRGNTVMLGYHNDHDATEDAFRGGVFHTGDLGVMHVDGYIEVKDRSKDIIISGGENISTIEIENALISHTSVRDVAVIGVPSEKWGERPHAFVLLEPGSSIDAFALQEHASATVARFKVPDFFTFVDELPRTATGKVTKAALRRLATNSSNIAES